MTTTISICGYLSRDPETRVTPNGAKITSFSIPTNHGKDKETTWWRASFWGEKFEKIMPYLKKGSLISVTGSLTRCPNIYTKNNATLVSALEISADLIQFLPNKKEENPEQKSQNSAHVYKTNAASEIEDADLPF